MEKELEIAGKTGAVSRLVRALETEFAPAFKAWDEFLEVDNSNYSFNFFDKLETHGEIKFYRGKNYTLYLLHLKYSGFDGDIRTEIGSRLYLKINAGDIYEMNLVLKRIALMKI